MSTSSCVQTLNFWKWKLNIMKTCRRTFSINKYSHLQTAVRIYISKQSFPASYVFAHSVFLINIFMYLCLASMRKWVRGEAAGRDPPAVRNQFQDCKHPPH